MSLRSSYIYLASGFLIGAGLMVGIITSTPQPRADTLLYLGVVAGFILAVTSLLGFFGIALRRGLVKQKLTNRHLVNSIRQGLEVAVLLVVLATIWYLTGISWWEVVLLTLAVVFAELAIVFKRSPSTRS